MSEDAKRGQRMVHNVLRTRHENRGWSFASKDATRGQSMVLHVRGRETRAAHGAHLRGASSVLPRQLPSPAPALSQCFLSSTMSRTCRPAQMQSDVGLDDCLEVRERRVQAVHRGAAWSLSLPSDAGKDTLSHCPRKTPPTPISFNKNPPKNQEKPKTQINCVCDAPGWARLGGPGECS